MSATLHLDTDGLRTRLNSAISSYNEAIENAATQRPAIDPSVFGEGFVHHGAGLAGSVDKLHNQTMGRLRARVNQFESMLNLTKNVESADDSNAAELGRHG